MLTPLHAPFALSSSTIPPHMQQQQQRQQQEQKTQQPHQQQQQQQQHQDDHVSEFIASLSSYVYECERHIKSFGLSVCVAERELANARMAARSLPRDDPRYLVMFGFEQGTSNTASIVGGVIPMLETYISKYKSLIALVEEKRDAAVLAHKLVLQDSEPFVTDAQRGLAMSIFGPGPLNPCLAPYARLVVEIVARMNNDDTHVLDEIVLPHLQPDVRNIFRTLMDSRPFPPSDDSTSTTSSPATGNKTAPKKKTKAETATPPSHRKTKKESAEGRIKALPTIATPLPTAPRASPIAPVSVASSPQQQQQQQPQQHHSSMPPPPPRAPMSIAISTSSAPTLLSASRMPDILPPLKPKNTTVSPAGASTSGGHFRTGR